MLKLNRRRALVNTGALFLTAWHGPGALAADSPAVAFLDKSTLIYLSPYLSNGNESKCHAEVWFVHHDSEIFVVTKSDAWRTQALRRGLKRASVWIGEFGVWTRARDRYRSAPHLVVEGDIETDNAAYARILEHFGRKYADEWGTWGPRFRNGLADGSRVLLRYRVAA